MHYYSYIHCNHLLLFTVLVMMYQSQFIVINTFKKHLLLLLFFVFVVIFLLFIILKILVASPSLTTPEQGQTNRVLVNSLNQPQGKWQYIKSHLPLLCQGGRLCRFSIPVHVFTNFCERKLSGCCPTVLSRLRPACILHQLRHLEQTADTVSLLLSGFVLLGPRCSPGINGPVSLFKCHVNF